MSRQGNASAGKPATPRATVRIAGKAGTRSPKVATWRAAPQSPFAALAPSQRPVAAKAVGSFVPRLTQQAFEKYGFSAASLITDWATIVGADIARYTAPERLKWPRRSEISPDEEGSDTAGPPGATLHLAVEAGRALDIQYKASQLIERINAYFGYRAIASMRIVQVAQLASATADTAPRGAVKPIRAPNEAAPPPEIAGIADDGLRAALERMAAGIGARKGAATLGT